MPDFTIIELTTVDSTNNYAMQLIDADKAQHGLTVTAQTQTAGKGQRGRVWVDIQGQSLLMSIIIAPKRAIREQFTFNAAIAVAIANVLQIINKNWSIHIKWPNDIIVNDKKAGGVLIENVLRGNTWAYCVVGIGLNVNQDHFQGLPYATSLKMEGCTILDTRVLADSICQSIMDTANDPASSSSMKRYNEYLYQRGSDQLFNDSDGRWSANIVAAHADGTLEVREEDGTKMYYRHGQVEWVWGKG